MVLVLYVTGRMIEKTVVGIETKFFCYYSTSLRQKFLENNLGIR